VSRRVGLLQASYAMVDLGRISPYLIEEEEVVAEVNDWWVPVCRLIRSQFKEKALVDDADEVRGGRIQA